MLRTYKAVLRGNRIEWIDRPFIHARSVAVHITLLEEEDAEAANVRGDEMAQALEAIAESGGLSAIPDPMTWQREQRRERSLPGRND